jgi:hypothetical protein
MHFRSVMLALLLCLPLVSPALARVSYEHHNIKKYKATRKFKAPKHRTARPLVHKAPKARH